MQNASSYIRTLAPTGQLFPDLLQSQKPAPLASNLPPETMRLST